MKPPRSVWVVTLANSGARPLAFYTHKQARKVGWCGCHNIVRYDLHRPKPKRKARKGERSKR